MIDVFLKKWIGKLSFRSLLICAIVLGMLPTLIPVLHYGSKKRDWDRVSQRLLVIHTLSETKARKQYFNKIVRSVYGEVDPLYIENQLEPLFFLKKERETLEQLLQSPTFIGNEATEKRFAQLTSKANRLEFMQGNPQIGEGVQEATYQLSQSVEIDIHDLKEILNRIEGNRKGKPQLLITDLKINKKAHLSGNEVFELNMKLLKREFSS